MTKANGGMNGEDRDALLGSTAVSGPPFTLDALLFRSICAQVERDVVRQGGGLPMPDPAGFLALKLVLEKLAAIEARLGAIENKLGSASGRGLGITLDERP